MAGDVEDGGPGTDFHAVMQGYVSITPLQLDRTFREAFDGLEAGWRTCCETSRTRQPAPRLGYDLATHVTA